MNDNILEVRDLKVWFPIKKGIFSRTAGYVKAVDGVSFDLRRGETLGVVGESGCGKSTTSRAVLMLNKPCGGTIKVDGVDISTLRGKALLEYHRKVQVVFQDPNASLNPRHTICDIVTEGMIYHGLCRKEERNDRAVELLESVGLDASVLYRYPHEFSGGQRQRICIARAIALKPELLICDEAVSALDLSIRAQVLDLLGGLKKKLGLSFLFITHDVGVVQHIADHIIVMNHGKIVEEGTADEVLKNPKEEYTRRLMASVPKIGRPLPDMEDIVE
ncbi:MAG: ABC transporter ATP-binding protein [Kiritimatiellae bacterium]|nr:ABC transporter ATP-binding protein [Kiritimatiellia bacterium]